MSLNMGELLDSLSFVSYLFHQSGGWRRGSVSSYLANPNSASSSKLQKVFVEVSKLAPRRPATVEMHLFKSPSESLNEVISGSRLHPNPLSFCSQSFYCPPPLPGLGDRLRTSLDQSSPALALVPVLDLSDSRILHLSCWLSA